MNRRVAATSASRLPPPPHTGTPLRATHVREAPAAADPGTRADAGLCPAVALPGPRARVGRLTSLLAPHRRHAEQRGQERALSAKAAHLAAARCAPGRKQRAHAPDAALGASLQACRAGSGVPPADLRRGRPLPGPAPPDPSSRDSRRGPGTAHWRPRSGSRVPVRSGRGQWAAKVEEIVPSWTQGRVDSDCPVDLARQPQPAQRSRPKCRREPLSLRPWGPDPELCAPPPGPPKASATWPQACASACDPGCAEQPPSYSWRSIFLATEL